MRKTWILRFHPTSPAQPLVRGRYRPPFFVQQSRTTSHGMQRSAPNELNIPHGGAIQIHYVLHNKSTHAAISLFLKEAVQLMIKVEDALVC